MAGRLKNRGSEAQKNKGSEAQKGLLDAIWKLKGGVGNVARILDEHIQSPINWRNRSGVPLIMCMSIAEKLKIPIWGLNYKELRQFYGTAKTPSWAAVVQSYGLEKHVVGHILALPPPVK